MRKCPICEKGEFNAVGDITLPFYEKTFVVKGERCSKCDEEFPYREELQKIFKKLKEK